METVVIVLMGLVCFNFLLKQTYRKLLSVGIIAGVCALFTALVWPLAIEQSKTQIADWLSNPRLMLDTSVILSIEVLIQMAYCMVAAHLMHTGTVSRRMVWSYRLLRWFPGILIFPVLFCGLVALIFALPGYSFEHIAWCMAIGVLAVIPAGSWFLRWLMPEKELRLELLFLTNALIAILGVVATVNGRTAVKGVAEVNWSALGGLALLILLFGLAGGVIRKYRMKKKVSTL